MTILPTEQLHRGRIQAQGGRPPLEESESWAQSEPLALSTGLSLLVALRDRLSTTERKEREVAFDQAGEYMLRASKAGGATGPTKKTFPQKLTGSGPRVDVEVIKGLAFV